MLPRALPLDSRRGRTLDSTTRVADGGPMAERSGPDSELREVHRPAAVRRGRAAASILLVVVSSLLTPAAITGAWLDRELTDTDRWVETVAPLARDPDVQAAVQRGVVDALSARVDLDDELEQALPDSASFLAAPISASLRSLIDEVVGRILDSDQFASLWDGANRAAHDQLVATLTSSGQAGVVELDLSGVAGRAGQRLEELGVPIPARTGDAPLTFELMRSDQLASAQSAFRTFDRLADVLPWLVAVLYLAAVAIAVDRRKGVLWSAWGLVLSTGAVVVGLAIGRDLYLDALPDGASLAANEAIYDTLTQFLRGSTRAVLAVGLVALASSVVAGPSGAARRVRLGASRLLGPPDDGAGSHEVTSGPVGAFVGRNLAVLRGLVGVIAAIVLVAQSTPSAGSVLWTAVAALVALALLEIVARAAGPEAAAPTRASAHGRGSDGE